MLDFKGHCFEKDIILVCIRWYLAYPLSYRNLEEMMEERGVSVDHTSIYRWVRKFTPGGLKFGVHFVPISDMRVILLAH